MDDWQVGDLALCVKRGAWHDGFHIFDIPVRAGMILTVRRVGRAIGFPCSALWFEGVDDRVAPSGFGCIRFRKIRPLTDDERDSFLADLDEPITPARRVAPVGAALNARVGHVSPLACPASSLPGPSADDTPRHADGSGLLFNLAHDAEVSNG